MLTKEMSFGETIAASIMPFIFSQPPAIGRQEAINMIAKPIDRELYKLSVQIIRKNLALKAAGEFILKGTCVYKGITYTKGVNENSFNLSLINS